MSGSPLGRALISCAAVAALAACGASQPLVGAPGATARTSPHATNADRGDPWLYVTGNANNSVVIYDLARSGFPVVGTITNGVSSPGGVAVDKNGQVYVANETGTVTIYSAGKSTPNLTLSEDLEFPQSVAVDASGNVYVCSRGSSPAIVVFPPGEATPSKTITNALIQVPNQIQFDAGGNLYYADGNTGVSELTAGSQNMTSLGLQDLQSLRGLALDRYGNLYVGTYGSKLDGAREYLRKRHRPIRRLRDSRGSDLYASGEVKHREYIFLPDSYNATVKAFEPDSRNPAFVINTSDAQTSVGVSIKAAGVP
ncbi:MAG TPA: hypothetical protein VKR56_11485 [Candidatus Cybelea sp.]|nr:hypothetical protein [Candidatus Cybelea sp.]